MTDFQKKCWKRLKNFLMAIKFCQEKHWRIKFRKTSTSIKVSDHPVFSLCALDVMLRTNKKKPTQLFWGQMRPSGRWGCLL